MTRISVMKLSRQFDLLRIILIRCGEQDKVSINKIQIESCLGARNKYDYREKKKEGELLEEKSLFSLSCYLLSGLPGRSLGFSKKSGRNKIFTRKFKIFWDFCLETLRLTVKFCAA